MCASTSSGAHSSIGGRRFANAPSIDAYVSRRGPEHLAARLFDDGGDARLEEMMLALRTDRGIARTACDPRTADELVVEGLATVDAGRIRLTDHGYLVLNDVVLRLLAATPC